MVTYLRKSVNKAIHRNKSFTLTYLNEKGETHTIKKEQDLYSLCLTLMNEKELQENDIVEEYSYDIDNSCKYAWDFNTKKALFNLINNLKKLEFTLVQVTYNKNQIYSIKNENINLKELENVKKQRDIYKKQIDIQKEIINIYQDNEENEEQEI